MKKNNKTIDYEWLTKPTGDPFADTGGYVIQYLWENVYPDKDIDELIDFVTKIYVNDWGKTIYFFFPNSPIINSSSKNPVKDTVQKYLELIQGKDAIFDFCRISGRKTGVFKTKKDQFILSGSGKLVNYHHFFDNGILLSKEIIIRLLFVPLGVLRVGKYMGLIQSNNIEVAKYICKINIAQNLNNIAIGTSREIAESDSSIAANSIFKYASLCIKNLDVAKDEKKNISLTMFHFTNYNQGPDLDLYKFSSTLFSFYRFCELKYKTDWKEFINSYYRKKDTKYNQKSGKYKIEKKGKTEVFSFKDFSKWYNRILSNLLDNQNITPEFLNWSKKGNKLHFDIIRIYQQNIRNMKKETINKIMELADFIINDRGEDEIKKFITRLNGISKAFELRRFLLKLIDENYNEGNETPIISVKDYTDYLFSDSGNTGEIRDVLLIAIYQKMHELNLKVDVDLEEELNENIEQN